MDKKRKAEIDWYLDNETNDEETQAWRDELTEEESAYVQAQDEHYERGILRLCGAMVVKERIRQRWKPEEIAELEDVGDHCRVRLRSGEALLARWAPDGGLHLEKLGMEGGRDARRLA